VPWNRDSFQISAALSAGLFVAPSSKYRQVFLVGAPRLQPKSPAEIVKGPRIQGTRSSSSGNSSVVGRPLRHRSAPQRSPPSCGQTLEGRGGSPHRQPPSSFPLTRELLGSRRALDLGPSSSQGRPWTPSLWLLRWHLTITSSSGSWRRGAERRSSGEGGTPGWRRSGRGPREAWEGTRAGDRTRAARALPQPNAQLPTCHRGGGRRSPRRSGPPTARAPRAVPGGPAAAREMKDRAPAPRRQ
jgi:hypothetical protein